MMTTRLSKLAGFFWRYIVACGTREIFLDTLMTIQEFDHLIVNGSRIQPGAVVRVQMNSGTMLEGKVLKIFGTVGGVQIRVLCGSLVLNVGVDQIVDEASR
jgi:hypothetical protein